ncbi:EmrA Multidrug resistance efflux pump [Burkholderiales bacterium]
MSTLDHLEDELTNTRRPARVGLGILAVGLGGFLLWAALAPLDEGVPTQGMVSIDTKRRAVQHLQGGLISQVLVGEGQMVKEGELLLRLDDSTAKAVQSAAAQSVAAIRENQVAQQAVLEGLKAAERSRQSQLALITRELEGVRGLVKDGFAPVVQQLQLERQQAELQTAIRDTQTNQQRTQQALAELSHQMVAAQQKLKAAEQDLQRLEIRSPAGGQVVGLNIQSVGAVVQPAQKIMDIVPQNETLVIETRVSPQFIDRVALQDPVDLRFSAFANSPQLVVPGRLISISQDVLVDQQTGQPYYLARAEVTPEGLKALGSRSLQAGMPVEVIIKTGSRTLLTYLLHPLTKRVAASLKEE